MCMVLFHAMYTLGFMYDYPVARELFYFFSHISPAFAFAFIMMCGISCTLSRSNLRRSIPIIGASLVVTLVSVVVMPYAPIYFGILHLLGVSVLVYSLIERLPFKLNSLAGLIICLLIFALTYNLPHGYLGFEGIYKLNLPENLFESDYFMAFGFISPFSAYSDYFPLIPWFFAFLSGVYAGRLLKGRYPAFMYKKGIGFLSILGTNAFVIYVLHQPIIYGVAYILTLIYGGIIK